MNADLPEEWFRARERGDEAVSHAGMPVANPPLEGQDERFTDQFKPGYIPRPGEDAADDGAGLTHFNPARAGAAAGAAPRPGRPAAPGGATGTGGAHASAPDGTTLPGEPAARTHGEDAAGPGGLRGSYGENSAGATFSVGEVRRPRVTGRHAPRGRRVRRIIQSAIVLVVALAVGLIGGSYLAARNQSSPAPSRGTTASTAPSASSDAPYSGPLKQITGVKASAQCTAQSATDSAGRPVTYQASNMVDGVASTAWRCPGAALGQRLTFTLPAGSNLVGLGIVNGYSKNAGDGTDYYERFRRVLRVQWTINDRTAVQTLTDHRESEQTITIAPQRVDRPVVLTIQQTSDPGQSDSASNATLLSTVAFYTSAN